MEELPLLVFEDEQTASRILEALHYLPHMEVENGTRYTCELTGMTSIIVHMLRGGPHQFVEMLFNQFNGLIFLYTKHQRASTICAGRMFINAPHLLFLQKLGFTHLSDADRNCVSRVVRQYVHVRQYQDSLQTALAQSMETYESEQASRKRPLPEQWEKVLQSSEDAKEGDATCAICSEKRASICFVECGHMSTCDDCVREWGSRQDTCPYCRATVERIVRPRV